MSAAFAFQKPAPAKADAKPRKAAGKDKSSDKKVQKGKRGAKGKQAEVANQETKEDLPAENGETKNEEVRSVVFGIDFFTLNNRFSL
uniref:High mobility group nucleosome binding domain 1 n=1 Tax=Marmota marmota marmota TaxID=9994 RepID=A0A8C5YVF7_MARMA